MKTHPHGWWGELLCWWVSCGKTPEDMYILKGVSHHNWGRLVVTIEVSITTMREIPRRDGDTGSRGFEHSTKPVSPPWMCSLTLEVTGHIDNPTEQI